MKETEKRMRIKRLSGLWLGSISLVLGLLMLLQVPVSAATADLSYGKGTASDRTLTASQMFEGMYGNDLSAAERDALDALAEVSLTYSRVPDSVVKCEYDGNTGVLTVLVNTYKYVAQNGQTVVWRPTKVWFNKGKSSQKTAALTLKEEGLYQCSFSGMTTSQEFMLDVDFAWEVTIKAEIADKLLILPYAVAEPAHEELSEYEQYQDALTAYEWYLAYPSKKAAYDEYLKQKAEYDKEKEKYDAYVDALAKYHLDLQKYNENEQKKKEYAEKLKAYTEYWEFRMKDDAFYEEYEVYLRNLTQIENALKVLDSAYISAVYNDPEKPWSFYKSIKGPTATSFLDALAGKEAATGIPRSMIDEARQASQTLKNLLIEYDAIRTKKYKTEFARIGAKFAFYEAHYDELRRNLEIFYKDMKEIYCTNGIPALVEGVGKTTQVQTMVAQLYALYTAMDDSVTMDPNWVLKYSAKGQKTMNEILNEKHRLSDSNLASPGKSEMPEEELVRPEDYMEPVDHPGEPNYDSALTKPLKPTPVKEPSPIAAVENPGDQPAACEKPDPVEKPTLTSVERALVEEYRKGTLKRRTPGGQDKVLRLTQTVSCKRSFRAVNVVTFYYPDGTKMGEILVERGSLLKYYADEYPNWERPGDEIYSSYDFLGWVRYGVTNPSQSDYLDLDSIRVTEDLEIGAHYHMTKQRYTVTWDINGKKTTQNYDYGQIPVCPVSTAIPNQGEISFVFQGWSSVITPVQGNVTYRAVYKENRPEYKVTWIYGLNGERVFETWVPYGYPADDSTVPVQITPDDYYYVFLGWSEKLSSSVKGELTYRAGYRTVPIATHEDGTVCSAEHTSDTVILRPVQGILQISDALEYALGVGKQLEIAWESFSVTFTVEQMQALKDDGCVKISLREERREADGAVYYQLEFMKKRYSYDPQLLLDVAVCRPSFDRVIGLVYLAGDASERAIESISYADKLVFEIQSGDRILYRPRYVLQVTDPSGKSDYTSVPTEFAGGETVNLSVNCYYGYEVVGAVLTYLDGRREEVGAQFIMPAEPISVEMKVDRIVFLITFEVDGQVYKQMSLFYNDLIVPPADPTKADDGTYTYFFDGWSPQVWNKAVYRDERNPVFTAVFTAHPKNALAADDYRGSFVTRVIAMGLSGILLVVGSILCVIHRKRVGPFVRRVIKGFVPFVRRCSSWIKTRVGSVWNKIAKRNKEP